MDAQVQTTVIIVTGSIITTLITTLGLVFISKINKLNKSVNGKMEELLTARRAEGNRQGREERKAEQEPINKANIAAAIDKGNLKGREEQTAERKTEKDNL